MWSVLSNLSQGCPIFPKLVLNDQISWYTTPYHNLNIGPVRRLISSCVEGWCVSMCGLAYMLGGGDSDGQTGQDHPGPGD